MLIYSQMKSVKLSGAAIKYPRKRFCVKNALNTTNSLAGRPVFWAANDDSANGISDIVVLYPISQQLGRQWQINVAFDLIANALITSVKQSWWNFPQTTAEFFICGTKNRVQLHIAWIRVCLHSLKQFYKIFEWNFNHPEISGDICMYTNLGWVGTANNRTN